MKKVDKEELAEKTTEEFAEELLSLIERVDFRHRDRFLEGVGLAYKLGRGSNND